MSETVLDHGYIPEEHAPDPVISHGDPTAPGKIAIWLFLASEIMFFIAILGTYIILRSGSPGLFLKHASMLDKKLDGFGELFRMLSYEDIGPAAMLSRACAGSVGYALIGMRSLHVSPRRMSRAEGVCHRWKLIPQPLPLGNGGESSTIA